VILSHPSLTILPPLLGFAAAIVAAAIAARLRCLPWPAIAAQHNHLNRRRRNILFHRITFRHRNHTLFFFSLFLLQQQQCWNYRASTSLHHYNSLLCLATKTTDIGNPTTKLLHRPISSPINSKVLAICMWWHQCMRGSGTMRDWHKKSTDDSVQLKAAIIPLYLITYLHTFFICIFMMRNCIQISCEAQFSDDAWFR